MPQPALLKLLLEFAIGYRMSSVTTASRFVYVIIRYALTLLIILALPTLIVGFTGTILLRQIVIVLARICRPDLLDICDDPGVLFDIDCVYSHPRATQVFHFVCDGPPLSLETLRKEFRQRIFNPSSDGPSNSSYAKLQQHWSIYLGFVFWCKDSHFKLEDHIREFESETLTITEQELEVITARLITKPYVDRQSPWEVLLIPNYRARWNRGGHQQSVITIRMHHGLADSLSVNKLFMRLVGQEEEHGAREQEVVTLSLCGKWRHFASQALQLLPVLYDFTGKCLLDARDGANCWHFQERELRKSYRTFFSAPLRVQDIKRVEKENPGVSYNAVAFSCTLGAIFKLMRDMSGSIPKKLAVFYPYPVPKHPGGLVNHYSGDFFTVRPISNAKSALSLLAQVSMAVKSSKIPTITPIWVSWLLKVPPFLPFILIKALRSSYRFTISFPNFSGPRQKITVWGDSKLVEIIPAAGNSAGDCGAIASMASACGIQRVSLSLDEKLLESFQDSHVKFAEHLAREFEQLLTI